jgi:hypothetical protein
MKSDRFFRGTIFFRQRFFSSASDFDSSASDFFLTAVFSILPRDPPTVPGGSIFSHRRDFGRDAGHTPFS